jgi:hypothetical protein
MRLTRAFLTALALFAVPTAIHAQTSIDLTVNDVGLSFGNASRITGVRINHRDTRLERVNGVNLTVMGSKRPLGEVRGVGIGVVGIAPNSLSGVGISGGYLHGSRMTGLLMSSVVHADSVSAEQRGSVRGIAIGALSVASDHRIRGVAIAPMVDANGWNSGTIEGITAGGFVGAGMSVSGVTASGILRTRRASGVSIGLLGVRARDFTNARRRTPVDGGTGLRGITLAGLTASGDSIVGITAAGLSVSGERIRGITVSPFRVTGTRLSGITVGGVFTQGAESLHGVAAGLVVASPDLRGIAAGMVVGGGNVTGVSVAALGIAVEQAGTMHGLAVSPFNVMHGTQRGLSIGLLNSARNLHGVQIGLINIAQNNPKGRRVLPLINWHRD